MAEDLYALVEKLNEPNQADDALDRVAMCRQALTLFERETDLPLWADLHIIWANNVIRSLPVDSAECFVEAVDHYEQALQVYTREAYPKDWAFIHNKLGDLCRKTASGATDPKLVQAIKNYQKAIEGYTLEENAGTWAMLNANIALCFQLINGGLHDLEQAIHYYREALKVYTIQGSPHQWAIVQHNLGDVHQLLSSIDLRANDEQALAHYEQALQVYDRQHFPEEWATLQVKVARLYVNRRMGEPASNLEQAIHHYQLALQVRTHQTHPVQWANTLNNLASTYLLRIAGERKDNLEQALHNYQQASTVFTRQQFPGNWAMLQNNLGEVYRNRIAGDRATNLEEAIRCFKQSLLVRKRETNTQDWAMTQSNLGETYRYRIFGERTANLEKSIHYFHQALETLMPGEAWAKVQNNLAAAYRDRIAGRRSQNLVQAIEHYNQAQHILTRQAYPLEWAIIQQNIAIAYSDLSQLNFEAESSSDKAILHCRQALEVLTRQSFPEDWAMVQMTLGVTYANRIAGDRIGNLQYAEECYLQALTFYTFENFPEAWASAQNDLGCIYTDLVQHGQRQYLEQAIAVFAEALQIRKIARLPGQYQQTQRNLVDLFFAERRWGEASEACQAAITAGNLMFDESYTEVGRQVEVEAVARLFARAVYCLWQLHQPASALHQLEQGKTHLLAEALSLGNLNLASLPSEQKKHLLESRQEVAVLEAEMRLSPDTLARRSDNELTELLHTARRELRQRLAAIGQTHPDLIPAGLNVPSILALIPQGGALVAPFITSQGSAAFVIPHGTEIVNNDHILPLPKLTTAYLSELLQGAKDISKRGGWLGVYDHFTKESDMPAQEAWFQEVNSVTSKLWATLLGPIHKQLQTMNLSPYAPVLLMPQGGLGLLPLHAAWYQSNGKSHYFSDDYTVTYAPSTYALNVSRQRASQPERQARSLFAAINPTSDPKLKYTPVEGEAIAQLFPPADQTILQESNATAAAFKTAAQGYAYIHYSGHGYYHWLDPLQSGLQLADKPYTLSDILSGLDLSTCRLVTLSACETGITDIRQSPDEYVGLPAGFLQAGAPAVISTLWAVNDLSTMLLMERFYQLHLQNNLDMASALRQAQLWLRDVTAQELATRFGEERMSLKGHRLTLAEASDYWRRFASLEPSSKPFAHPHYWAAFTFTGA